MSGTNNVMDIHNKDLKQRIITLSYRRKLSHIGSCLTAVDIIEEIYKTKKPDEKFVLSSGHAGLALYVVLEKYKGIDAEQIFEHHGVHPDRCSECQLDCSSGSLGMGLPIAVGMALADRSKTVYCLISDGECSEGSIWEALHIANQQKLTNLMVYVNVNGWGAYHKVDTQNLFSRLAGRDDETGEQPYGNVNIIWKSTNVAQLPFLIGQSAHYVVMTEQDYKTALELLS